jgi:hypothetical protein
MPDSTPFDDVTVVRVRRTEIEIEARWWKVRVVPKDYEDRQRLLWELALRCNAAVERGIDEAAAEARAKARPLVPAPRAKPSASPDAPVALAPPADPSRLTDLDRAMTGLGSALAGPMTPRNPAPPRKSGLGVGLFPAPPEG